MYWTFDWVDRWKRQKKQGEWGWEWTRAKGRKCGVWSKGWEVEMEKWKECYSLQIPIWGIVNLFPINIGLHLCMILIKCFHSMNFIATALNNCVEFSSVFFVCVPDIVAFIDISNEVHLCSSTSFLSLSFVGGVSCVISLYIQNLCNIFAIIHHPSGRPTDRMIQEHISTKRNDF